MLQVADDNTVTEQVWCPAGHEWTWSRSTKGGTPPRGCPEHRMFFIGPLPQRLQPPETTLQEWNEQAKVLGDEDYVQRWGERWKETARQAGARRGTFRLVQLEPLDEYVRSIRLVELHRLFAQDQPYIEARGTVKAHPGWELADRERQRAERLAVDLGLMATPPAPSKEEKSKKQAVNGYVSRIQESAQDHDSVLPAVGPDGESL